MVVAGDEPQGLFSLGSLESTAAVRISPTLAHFNQRYPKIHLALSTGPSGTMIDGVLEGNLSAAFVDGPLVHPGLAPPRGGSMRWSPTTGCWPASLPAPDWR